MIRAILSSMSMRFTNLTFITNNFSQSLNNHLLFDLKIPLEVRLVIADHFSPIVGINIEYKGILSCLKLGFKGRMGEKFIEAKVAMSIIVLNKFERILACK